MTCHWIIGITGITDDVSLVTGIIGITDAVSWVTGITCITDDVSLDNRYYWYY